MSTERTRVNDPRIQAALSELQGIIRAQYPDATFEVSLGDDPEGVYLTATVDREDVDEVLDLVIDRLYDFQVEQELPVYVIPIRPLERVLASRPLRVPIGEALLGTSHP